MKVINFKCPECGEEVLAIKRLIKEVVELDGIDGAFDTEWFINGESSEEPTDMMTNYGCVSCGFVIGFNDDEALRWLYEHGMVEEDGESE